MNFEPRAASFERARKASGVVGRAPRVVRAKSWSPIAEDRRPMTEDTQLTPVILF